MTRRLRIDLSRLVWRARHVTPSGIDRVERAYARHYLAQSARPVTCFARLGSLGARAFAAADMVTFLDRLEQEWSQPQHGRGLSLTGWLVARSQRLGPAGSAITINPSHQNWHRKRWLEQCRGADGRLVLFLHDTIPSDYPEYARAGGAARHEERLQHGLAVADAFIVNSAATAQALARYSPRLGPARPFAVAPIGLDPLQSGKSAIAIPAEPYFVCLGTIEPRKNHLLLLHLWRALAERGQNPLPRLVIVGRRGWENEQIVDLLDRSLPLAGHVTEHNALGDHDLAALLRGARALLMPSFAEGFGMPVSEALALGVPVIASDLPVYAETAGTVPDYLDPLDGPGWTKAVLDYAQPDSPARAAQMARLRAWQAPDWAGHFARVDELLERLD